MVQKLRVYDPPVAREAGPLRNSFVYAVFFYIALLVAGCGGGGPTPSNIAGTGRSALSLETVEWGRLVDILDDDGVLVERNVLIRSSLQSTPTQYRLGRNAITQAETLTILYPIGNPQFTALMRQAQSGLTAVVPKGPNAPPTFTRVGRNGALRLQFSELVDPATVNRLTVQLQVDGIAQDLRYIVKNGQIGLDGKPKGVVLMDFTITALDQVKYGIPENPLGLPASANQTDANLLLRIPTKLDPLFGQTQVLTNKAGTHSLTATASDPTIYSPNYDPIVVRAARSGNSADPHNGFLLDQTPPRLITELPATIREVQKLGGTASRFTVTYQIDAPRCQSIHPKVGDLLQAGDGILLIADVENAVQGSEYVVQGSLLEGQLQPGAASITTAYASEDAELQLCWIKFSPEPQELPAELVDPYASIQVRFDEAMDPQSIKSMETMVLTSFTMASAPDPTRPFDAEIESVGDYIGRQLGYQTIFDGSSLTGSGRIKFGPIESSPDFRNFVLSPIAGMTDAHQEGAALNLCLALRDDEGGIQDLAGNPLDAPTFVAGNITQAERIRLAGGSESWPTTRYFALRVNELDENLDGLSEYRGQFTFEPGRMKGRPLSRFSRIADQSNNYIGQRIALSSPIMSPLTPAGSVLMTIYGYHHLGLGLLTEAEFNLDVEGLHWSPFAGTIYDDVFDRYSVALAHSKRFPDDYINPTSGFPQYSSSGLYIEREFDRNILGFGSGQADEKIVADAPYIINATNRFTSQSGSVMYPYPEFQDTYTWRDTSFKASLTGARDGRGVPPAVIPGPVVYGPGQAPSIALPLLMRLRCYPEGHYYGINGFQTQVMVGSSALPAFRVFSSGGRDSGDDWNLVVPDVPPAGIKPTKGYNTLTGEPANQFGPELYWGQVDFVTRVSRVLTHFFEFGGEPSMITTTVVEPESILTQTQARVQVEFRGSASLSLGDCTDSANHLNDAISCFDSYGEEMTPTCCLGSTIGAPTDWTMDPTDFLEMSELPKYFQLRFSFVADIDLNIEAELDAFGFAWDIVQP